MAKQTPPDVVARHLTFTEKKVLLEVCRVHSISKRPTSSAASTNAAYHTLVNQGLLDVDIAVCARLYTPTPYGKRVEAHVLRAGSKRVG